MVSKPKNPVRVLEADLYEPVKGFLQNRGYEVKGEIGKVDILACRGEEVPIIVELKTAFSLTLFHQAVDRLTLTDNVYIAVPYKPGKAAMKTLKRNILLCRSLGLGVMTVRLRDGFVQIHRDPQPYKPRKSSVTLARMMKEFSAREGDPNSGGITRQTIMTAYRQDAIKCLKVLYGKDEMKAAHVAKEANVPRARNILSDNHYGWFERARRGYYTLSKAGQDECGSESLSN